MWSRRLVRPQVRLGDRLPCNKWSLLWQSLTINQEESRLVLNRSPNQRLQVFFLLLENISIIQKKVKEFIYHQTALSHFEYPRLICGKGKEKAF